MQSSFINLSKKVLNQHLTIHIVRPSRGPSCRVGYWRILRAILYRLRTGCSWCDLPMKSLFGRKKFSYKSVYYYFNKWSKDGSLENIHRQLIAQNQAKLNLNVVSIDGTHTRCSKDCIASAYQGKKKGNTTNTLMLTDKSGVPIVLCPPRQGNHHDVYRIKETVLNFVLGLKQRNLRADGLFVCADAGFDCQAFYEACQANGLLPNVWPNARSKVQDRPYIFDKQLYKFRYTIERTNSWFDNFKAVKTRYDKLIPTWNASLHLAAACISCSRFNYF